MIRGHLFLRTMHIDYSIFFFFTFVDFSEIFFLQEGSGLKSKLLFLPPPNDDFAVLHAVWGTDCISVSAAKSPSKFVKRLLACSEYCDVIIGHLFVRIFSFLDFF